LQTFEAGRLRRRVKIIRSVLRLDFNKCQKQKLEAKTLRLILQKWECWGSGRVWNSNKWLSQFRISWCVIGSPAQGEELREPDEKLEAKNLRL
jgi:hypothetical protein